MAFCNSCGMDIFPGTRFCEKCGAAYRTAPGKVGAAVVIAIVGLAPVGFLVWRAVQHAGQDGNKMKVETPFVAVETKEGLQEAVHYLGVEPYPGARVLNEGATTATFGTVHGASLNFETSDSVEEVCSFYSSRHPDAAVAISDASRCTLVSSDRKTLTTINITVKGSMTRTLITSAPRKSGSAVK